MAHLTKISLLITLALLFVNQCERKGENIPTKAPTANFYLQTGWASYESGDYQAALNAFTASKARDAIKEDAYNGLGWTYGKLQNYDQSISNFLLLLSLTENNTMKANAYAGLAMTYGAMQIATTEEENRAEAGMNAIKYANMVINIDPNYQFEHDKHINISSLHAMIAQCYFNVKDFIKALTEVDNYLEKGFRQELINNKVVKMREDSVTVSLLPETAFSGTAILNISFQIATETDTFDVNAQLVDVLSIKNVENEVLYNVVDFDQGGNSVTFYGNPIPQEEDIFVVSYEYADDYGIFLNNLLTVIKKYQ